MLNKKTAQLNPTLTPLQQPPVRSQPRPTQGAAQHSKWFTHPQGEPPGLSHTSLNVRKDLPVIFKSRVDLKIERQGLCHSCFTQLMAWLCWIIPAAICQMAEASKASLVLSWQSSIILKQSSGSIAIICHGLPAVCENGIIHRAKRLWCTDHNLGVTDQTLHWLSEHKALNSLSLWKSCCFPLQF